MYLNVKIMLNENWPLLFLYSMSFAEGPFHNHQAQQGSIRICHTNVFRITYKYRKTVYKLHFTCYGNASPSITWAICVGKFRLGIPFVKQLH